MPWAPHPGWPGVEEKVLSAGPGTVVGLLRFSPGAEEAPHVHAHGEHHTWVLEGRVRTQGRSLTAGSYLHVRSGTLHDLRDDGPGSLLLFAYTESADGA
jgi:quercetin dioxygenase-like cupin family protein